MPTYPKAIKPNYGLNVANVAMVTLATPNLAVTNRFVTSTNMIVGAYTLAQTTHADTTLARNVTVTHTQVGGVTDTLGTVLVTGTNIQGEALTETLTPVSATTVAGLKAFKTVTSIVGTGWVINTGNDTIVFGTGNVIGLPYWYVRQSPQVTASGQTFMVILGTALVAVTATFDATDISKCTVNATAGTYDGTKALYAFIYR